MIKPEIIVRQAKDVSGAIEKGNNNGILSLVTKISARAKKFCPVDTGQLRGSIMGRANRKEVGYEEGDKLQTQAGNGQGVVGTAVLHGVYQEFGTRYMAAQPYLRPAVDIEANAQNVNATIKKYSNKALTEEIKRAWKTRTFK